MARHHVDLLTELNAQDEINMTAAFINVTTQLGTVLGTPPAEKLEDRWLIAMYHRWVLGGFLFPVSGAESARRYRSSFGSARSATAG